MPIVVGVTGTHEAQRALKQLPEFAKANAQEAINVTAFRISQGAARRAPRRTGRLQFSITWKARPRSVSAVVGVSGNDVQYWKWLEYGTVKMQARPFLRPSAEAEAGSHEARLRRALAKAADQVERSASSGML